MSDTVQSRSEAKRIQWEGYRALCFIRCSEEPVWVWTAAHEFELSYVGLFLEDAPSATLDMGLRAMSFHVFDCQYLVPLERMTVKSLAHFEGVATFSPVARRSELLGAQVAAENVLRGLVNQQFLFKAAPGSLNGSLQ